MSSTILLLLLAACDDTPTDDTDAGSDLGTEAPLQDLQPLLAPLLEEYDVPAIGAARIEGGELTAYGAVGVRAFGTDVAVTRDDLWHLGSDTKAMTATLYATFVEEGTFTWDTTLADAFPGTAVHADLQDVTLKALLAHEGGVWTNPPGAVWTDALALDGVEAQRAFIAQATLTTAPTFTPGTANYSNTGFMLVGAAMEQATGSSWEELMTERLFTPLGMDDCGFGGTSEDTTTPRQPWGHLADGTPVPPGPGDDNPPALGPAGTVHCTLPAWSRFIADQIAGHRGEDALLTPASYTALHTALGVDNALGWFVTNRPWAGGTTLVHAGTNTMNYAVVWVGPNNDVAYLATTNIAGADGSLGGAVTDAAIVETAGL